MAISRLMELGQRLDYTAVQDLMIKSQGIYPLGQGGPLISVLHKVIKYKDLVSELNNISE